MTRIKQQTFLGALFLALFLAGCQTQPPELEASAANVSSLTLMNADTDRPVNGFDPIPNGATLDLSKLPTRNLNVRANVGRAGSVRFGLDRNKNYRTENNAPFALAGNSGSNYFEWTPSAGKHTLTATAYARGQRARSVRQDKKGHVQRRERQRGLGSAAQRAAFVL